MRIHSIDLGEAELISSYTKREHVAVVEDVVNGLLAVVTFASYHIFDAPFVHRMSARPCRVLIRLKLKHRKFRSKVRVRDKIIFSCVC